VHEIAQPLLKAVQQIDLTTPSWDVFVLLFFLIGVFLYGIALGRNRLILLLIALYFSIAVLNTSTLIRTTGIVILSGHEAAPLITFLIVFLLIFFIVGSSSAARALSQESHGPFWQTLIFAVLQVGLTISVALHLLPLSLQQRFSLPLRSLFIEPVGQLVWIVVPIVFLAFTRIKGGMKAFTS